jgi:haloalkane dehalogenase
MDGKSVRRTFRLALLVLIFEIAATSAQTDPAPNGMTERDHLRNVRYCEVLVVRKHFFSTTADVYNTLGLNDCPAEKWASLDTAKLKKEWNAAAIVLNGPRYFIMDRNAIEKPGNVESFDGLDARLLAVLEIRIHSNKRVPYTENGVQRQNRYVCERGKNVYELLSPDGNVYIMQSYSQEVDKELNEAGLLTLADRLKLPHGWKYRTRTLDEDLVIENVGGKAYVIQDELKNTYQRKP